MKYTENISELIKNIYSRAKDLKACKLITGREDLEGIIKLFKSPEGLDFCIKHHFPSREDFTAFKRFNLEEKGIYIDAGEVILEEPKELILIGDTRASINYDQPVRHNVTLMHGAEVKINAKAWSVVFVQGTDDCKVIKNISDNAIIL